MLLTAAIAVALAAADTYVVVLALEEMMSGVGLGVDQLQRATPIVSGFLLGYIAGLPVIGRLADVEARQRVLIWCLTLFLIGSVLTALATELPVMVAGRVIQGVGGGGLVPVTLALVADVLPRRQRGMGLGMVSAVQEIGSVLGPLLGAAILAVWSWRAIFWLNAGAAVLLSLLLFVLNPTKPDVRAHPRQWLVRLGGLVGLLGLAVIALALWAPERLTSDIQYGPPFVPYAGHTARLATPIGLWGLGFLAGGMVLTSPAWGRRLRRVDVFGALAITVALGCVVWTFAMADASREVMNPAGTWLLPVAAVAVAAYVVRHRTAAEPLVARGMFTHRVPTALLTSFLVGTALVAVIVEIPVLARLTVTNSQTSAAFVLLRFLAAVPVGAFIGGWLLRRTPPAVVTASGLGLAGLGILAMSGWGAQALTSWGLPTVILLVSGFGIGLTVAPINDVALTDAPDDAHAMASALVVVARMMGMVVGLALLTGIGLHRFSTALQQVPNPQRADVTAAGVLQVHTVLLGASVAAFLGAVVVLLGWRLSRVDRD